MRKVYLDHSATTPIRDEVIRAMEIYFSEEFGNASSIHTLGQRARKAIEDSRKRVASILGADSKEVIFTSGGTESDNLAIKGVAYASQSNGKHIVTSSIEHAAVLNCFHCLEHDGYEVTYLAVDEYGLVSPDSVIESIRPETVLVSIMLANNEVGMIQPLREIGEITKARGILFHTDAVQAMGKIPVKVNELNVDLLSISGHKIYGPKGIGALYIREGTSLMPLIHGGRHEKGYRPGTENVAAIVGLAKAVDLAEEEREHFFGKMHKLQSLLERGVLEKIDDVQINGPPEKRLPNISNVSFKSIDGESLLLTLDIKGIAASTGAACSSGSGETSHVLTAMGIAPGMAQGSLRLSLGRLNDEEDINYVLDILPEVVARLREKSP